jgi:hypothetical protein
MAGQARYPPQAPGDGFGNILLTRKELTPEGHNPLKGGVEYDVWRIPQTNAGSVYSS